MSVLFYMCMCVCVCCCLCVSVGACVCVCVVCVSSAVDLFMCKTPAIADLVILVDGSWSIGRSNFRRVRDFLEGLVTPFHIGPDRVQIGGTSSVVSVLSPPV